MRWTVLLVLACDGRWGLLLPALALVNMLTRRVDGGFANTTHARCRHLQQTSASSPLSLVVPTVRHALHCLTHCSLVFRTTHLPPSLSSLLHCAACTHFQLRSQPVALAPPVCCVWLLVCTASASSQCVQRDRHLFERGETGGVEERLWWQRADCCAGWGWCSTPVWACTQSFGPNGQLSMAKSTARGVCRCVELLAACGVVQLQLALRPAYALLTLGSHSITHEPSSAPCCPLLVCIYRLETF